MENNDLIFYRENNQIKSGGYSVDSFLLNHNKSATHTINNQEGGSKVSDLFKNKAVPSGLFYLNNNKKYNSAREKNEDGVLPDSIHDRLLELLNPENPIKYNIKTKKRRNRHPNKTKKR
tara:strand:+ start:1363 stop:1719 length:357 start_codon:yes stop_codon:yes gene_type:complete